MVTWGGAFTVIVTWAWPLLPSRSVARAVRVCVPTLSVWVMVPPVPSAPSRSEVQAVVLDTLPSSGSVAAAVNAIVSAWLKRAPLSGVVIVTAGRPETVIEREADAVRPPLSLTLAVRVCTPAVSVERVRLPPVPSAPSRLEVQVMAAVRLPSSRSVALAVRVTGVPWMDRAPSAGAVIVSAGGALTTIVIVFWPVRPRRVVAEAGVVGVPGRGVGRGGVAAGPRGPARGQGQGRGAPKA